MSSARWQCWRHGISRRRTRPSASSFRSRLTGPRSASGLRCSRLQPAQVVARVHQRTADHRGRAEPGARRLVLLAVDPLGVLAEGGLHPGRLAQHHLVDGPPPALDGDRLPADGVAGARVDVHGQHAAADRVAEAEVGRVDRIERADLRGHRVGQLVGVRAGPALAFLVHADMPVGLDEPGQDPAARRLDDPDARGNGEVSADRGDPARLGQHRPAVDRVPGDRNYPPPDDRHRLLSHSCLLRFRGPAPPHIIRPQLTHWFSLRNRKLVDP